MLKNTEHSQLAGGFFLALRTGGTGVRPPKPRVMVCSSPGDGDLCTVTVKAHVARLPVVSSAVQFTVVTPRGKVEPDGGAHVTVVPGTLSVTVGGGKLTTAWHCPAGILTATVEGQVIVGACVSLTVTEKEHVEVLSAASVAVQVTMDVPSGNAEPEGGVQVGAGLEQLSTTRGAEYVTTTEFCPGGAEVEILPEHVIRGAVVSFTVTLNEQLGPSSAVHVTGVTPTAKKEFEGGTHATPPHGPTVVGAA
jgi:hypothetical protein